MTVIEPGSPVDLALDAVAASMLAQQVPDPAAMLLVDEHDPEHMLALGARMYALTSGDDAGAQAAAGGALRYGLPDTSNG